MEGYSCMLLEVEITQSSHSVRFPVDSCLLTEKSLPKFHLDYSIMLMMLGDYLYPIAATYSDKLSLKTEE